MSVPSDKPRRRRRTATEARRAILDAAEEQLLAAGPAGVRLQEVAAAVGISHPTILHHFGSREDLVEAVSSRALSALTSDLIALIAEHRQSEPRALLDRVFHTLGDRGHARALTWLALSGREPRIDGRPLHQIARAVHGARVEPSTAQAPPSVQAAAPAPRDATSSAEPPFEDTLFAILLAAVAIFGDSVAGDAMRRSAGLGDDASAKERFRGWLCELLVGYLGHPDTE